MPSNIIVFEDGKYNIYKINKQFKYTYLKNNVPRELNF